MAVTASSSSHNPFRSPEAALSTSTGSSSTTSPPPASGNNSTGLTSAAGYRSDPTGLTDEEPPAYTPRPDAYQGEETIEYGPRRPFQSTPAAPLLTVHPAQPQSIPQPQSNSHALSQTSTPSLWRQITEGLSAQLAGTSLGNNPPPTGSWSAYPGHRPPNQHAPHANHAGMSSSSLPSSSLLRIPPPPRHPASSTTSSTTTQPTTASPVSPASDFARDFYAAGTGQPVEAARSAPNLPPGGYEAPPGPPPSTHATGGGSSDGAPTKKPTPGHPLLRDGKLLVYPKGFECDKCHNMGYKHADPSHPCKKCWSKHAKPFQGPLTYAYSSGPTTGTSTFQRPLPAFNAPRGSLSPHRNPQTFSPPPHPPPPPPRPHTMYAAPPPPPPQPQMYAPSFPPPAGAPHLRTLSPYDPRPPPGALVYPAGDPRIGGRLCWRCDGRGSVSFFLFDSLGCEVCGGVGRVF